MGDERRSEKVKATPVTDDPVRAKRDDEEAADASHGSRQVALRGKGDRAGFTELESVDHTFKGVGDQSAASVEMSRILDAGTPVTGLVQKVANLDYQRREEVAKRMADVGKVASGTELLQIADLVGLPIADKIRAALGAKVAPSVSALRAHVIELPIEKRIELLDEPTRALIVAKYPQPGDVIPGLEQLGPEVRKHKDIVAWYLHATPPRTVALAIMRGSFMSDDITQLAAVFNQIGGDGWQWALAIDPPLAAMQFGDRTSEWAQATNQPNVTKHLTAVAANTTIKKGTASGKSIRDMIPATGVDVAAVVAALQDARIHEHYLKEVQTLAASPYRERLIAAATLEQLEMILSVISSDSGFDWLVESPHATPEALRAITASWDPSYVTGIAEQPKLMAKLASKFPAAGPTDIFGEQAHLLYPLAATRPALRKWCTVNADARELLALVAHDSKSIATMWNGIIADGVAPDWYKGLGTGVGAANDERLRRLALNTPDQSASTWIRDTLIGDFAEDKVSNEAKKIDPVAFEADSRKRFEKGLADDETSDLGHRTSELSDEEVAKLRANPAELEAALPRMRDPWLLRNLLRIAPPLPLVLRSVDLWDNGLPSYIRTRSAQETADAFADDAVERKVRAQVKTPFAVLPALQQPAILAQVLTRGTTLTWLLQKSDPAYVLSLLANAPAGKAAAKIFTTEHLGLIPDMLDRKQDRAAAEKFAAFLPARFKDELRAKAEDPALSDDEDGEESEPEAPTKAKRGSFDRADVQNRQDELEAALALGDLRKGLDLVMKEPVSLANVMAVCREAGQRAATLVGKPENEATVKRLVEVVEMSPLSVFPDVPYYAYFHTPTSRAWLFKHESAIDILREVSNDPVLAKLIVDRIDATTEKTKDTSLDVWLSRMPTGTALSASERGLVKRMFDQSKTAVGARKLFEVRFGSRPGTTFSREELVKMWELLERVPDAHIEMGAVQAFGESKDLGGFSGVYSGGDQRITIEDNLVASGKKNTFFNQKLPLTREQLVAAYGYTDDQIKAKVTAKEIDEIKTAKGTHYVIKPVTTELLDSTVLHEIGHAVDDMLGSRTELVYGLAKWREFGESDIDALARDLGGWERVAPADQARIKDAWAVWLNSHTDDALDKFVPDNHPALAEKYRGVGIVELARKKQPIDENLGLMKGEYTIVNHKYQRFYRVPDKTRNAAPSAYAMTAPAEWFAECYAEYYRTYKGPGTEDKKGGQLAGWIKGWFDQNIDNLEYNPSRKDNKY